MPVGINNNNPKYFKVKQVLQYNTKMKSFRVRIRQRKNKRKAKSHICFLMGLLILYNPLCWKESVEYHGVLLLYFFPITSTLASVFGIMSHLYCYCRVWIYFRAVFSLPK